MRRTFTSFGRWAVVSLVAGGCTQPVPSQASEAVTTRSRESMATYVTISVAAPESPAVIAAIDAGLDEVDRLNSVLSEWRDGTDISKVNAAAGKTPVAVGPDAYATVAEGLEIGKASEGAFDITVGALWGAWDFKWENPKIPTAAELAPRLALIDYRRVQLDPNAHTVFLDRPGMKLAVGGIAKGYAVDQVSKLLKAKGYPHHLVVVGGEVYASGTRGSRKWHVGIRDPRGTASYGYVELQDEALSTSGNYERFFVRGGVRYHHILVPSTGQPARGLASVTVLARRSTEADGLSTAIFVLGKERGLALAQRRGVEILMFDEVDFSTTSSPGFGKRLVRLPAESTEPTSPTGEAAP